MTSDYVVVPRVATEEMIAAVPAQTHTFAHAYGTGHHSLVPMLGGGPREVYAAMVSAAPSAWRAISEADQVKQDETPVLLWNEETGMLPVVAEWSPNLRMWWTESGTMIGVDYPTHFCLLPGLPAPPSNPT